MLEYLAQYYILNFLPASKYTTPNLITKSVLIKYLPQQFTERELTNSNDKSILSPALAISAKYFTDLLVNTLL
jgi:hypothetical protein